MIRLNPSTWYEQFLTENFTIRQLQDFLTVASGFGCKRGVCDSCLTTRCVAHTVYHLLSSAKTVKDVTY
jgi:hypothetical protein